MVLDVGLGVQDGTRRLGLDRAVVGLGGEGAVRRERGVVCGLALGRERGGVCGRLFGVGGLSGVGRLLGVLGLAGVGLRGGRLNGDGLLGERALLGNCGRTVARCRGSPLRLPGRRRARGLRAHRLLRHRLRDRRRALQRQRRRQDRREHGPPDPRTRTHVPSSFP